MESITLDTFRRNAYRVLGLKATATQQEIDSAARLLRLHATGDAPPTFNDAPWLGPISRTPQDVDAALMRLTDPETRTMQRLWWFCNVPPVSDGGAFPPSTPSVEDRVRYRHDEAITALCRMLTLGGGGETLEKWRGVLGEFRALAKSDVYLQWLLETESAGHFEKQAMPDEIATFQSQMEGWAATALIRIADDYLDEQAVVPAGRIVTMLLEIADHRAGLVHEAADRIANRVDDLLVSQCNGCLAQIDAAWKTKRIRILKPALVRALAQCGGSIEDLRCEVVKWSQESPDRTERVNAQVFQVYWHVADAYEACHDKYAARQALLKGAEIARGTPLEPRLQQRIGSLTGARPVSDARDDGGERGSGGQYGNYFGTRSSRWGVVALIVLAVNALRFCTTFSTSSSPSNTDSSYYIPSVPGRNQSAPNISIESGRPNNPVRNQP